jgi:hypothetical protein
MGMVPGLGVAGGRHFGVQPGGRGNAVMAAGKCHNQYYNLLKRLMFCPKKLRAKIKLAAILKA